MSKTRNTPRAEDLPYRPCVGLMLINAQGKVWVGRRVGVAEGKNWQMPQGGIDKGETPKQAALRELEEETGTRKAEIIGQSKDWMTYDLPEPLIGKALKGKYRGQKQQWFALRFTGEEADINIDTDHPEFDAWRWVATDELVDLVWEAKRGVYRQVVSEFAPLASSRHPVKL